MFGFGDGLLVEWDRDRVDWLLGAVAGKQTSDGSARSGERRRKEGRRGRE
jgi:hypothetical protein